MVLTRLTEADKASIPASGPLPSSRHHSGLYLGPYPGPYLGLYPGPYLGLYVDMNALLWCLSMCTKSPSLIRVIHTQPLCIDHVVM